MNSFQQTQYQFTRHLREPDHQPVPIGIEERRMAIYRDLIYNNIESFISGGFPILRSIIADNAWHRMVRDFLARHHCQTPYFLEISQEFLVYLMQEREPHDEDLPFMLELAHYEWVELALDVATDTVPEPRDSGVSVLDGCPQVSPLVWCLSYRFPVHRIGPAYQPMEPPSQASFLLVFRNRADEVKFVETKAVTVRLLQLLQEEDNLTGRTALQRVAVELRHPNPTALEQGGKDLLESLLAQDIIANVVPVAGRRERWKSGFSG